MPLFTEFVLLFVFFLISRGDFNMVNSELFKYSSLFCWQLAARSWSRVAGSRQMQEALF